MVWSEPLDDSASIARYEQKVLGIKPDDDEPCYCNREAQAPHKYVKGKCNA